MVYFCLREQLLEAYRKLIELAKRDLGNLFERQNNNIIGMADGLREILEAEAQYAARHPIANQRPVTTARLITHLTRRLPNRGDLSPARR